MTRPRLLALLALPLAAACGDDVAEPTTSSTLPSTLPMTEDPDPSTGATNPTTGPSSTTGTTPASSSGPDSSSGPGETGNDTTTAPDDTTSATGSTTQPDPSTSTTGTTGTTDTTGAPPDTTTAGDSSTGSFCADGTLVCMGNQSMECDGMGGFDNVVDCADVCVDGLGCKLCVPGETECQGDDVLQCNDSGDGKDIVETCDPVQGNSCDAQLGTCVGACAGLGLSYIGCDYYPTVLQQHDGYNSPPNQYAVAVANTSNVMATITVTRGGNNVTVAQVAPMSVQVINLPWVDPLTKGQGPSAVVVDGAYRLRSNHPVTVYQYNPLASTTTNDASLLLPVNTWTGNYLVAAWQTWNFFGSLYPGFYAVVARADSTTVTLVPSTTGTKVYAGGGVAANGTGVVMLNEGDVLQVMSADGGDLTGTIVQADKPVQVFGGHECTQVPIGTAACDHLEESMFPIETLAKEYVVAPPVQVPNDALDKAQVVRIVASEDATTLTYSPDQPAAKNLAKAGDFVEILTTTAKFVVSADKRILVSQYMVGQDGGFGTSDPAMLLAVNPMQWRKSYLFHAATSWQANYVDVLAPKNAVVTVDGAAVGGWQPIGMTQYQVAHIKLSNAGNGNHSVVSDVGVGIGVYGVQSYGSYWYPGGLDLDLLPQ